MKYYQQEFECIKKEELKKLQTKRLKETAKLVYEKVPFYTTKFDALGIKPEDIKSVDDIVKLPFTVKTDLRDNYPFGLLACDKKDLVRLHASSGTTGKLTVVGYSKQDIDIWAELFARCIVMAGGSAESLVHVSYGYGLFTGGLGAHYGAEKLGATAIPVSSGNTARQIMLLKDFQSDIICCTPSYAIFIASELKNHGVEVKDLGLKAGIFGAEPWTDEMRIRIEEMLNIKAFDIYGLSEIMGPAVSMDCEEHDGKHIWEDHFIAEVIDPETLLPVEEGQIGELVLTTITKTGMPLIRYRTRDLCTLSSKPCKCGRTHVKMSKVIGRSDDMLIIRGVNVFPSQIETVLLKLAKGIEPHYQIVVNRENMLDTVDLLVEMNSALFSDEVKEIENLKKQLEREMNSALGIAVKVKLVEPNTLPRSEGKAKRVIDNRVL